MRVIQRKKRELLFQRAMEYTISLEAVNCPRQLECREEGSSEKAAGPDHEGPCRPWWERHSSFILKTVEATEGLTYSDLCLIKMVTVLYAEWLKGIQMGARENTEVFVSILNPGNSDEGPNQGGGSRNGEKGPPAVWPWEIFRKWTRNDKPQWRICWGGG